MDTAGGTPRIAVDVGGVTRYATYTSGSGTTALIFTYALVSGDVDLDGVTLSSPIQLNGGTIKDAAGNDATLNFTVPNTSGVLVNAAVPSGYTVSFADRTVTNVNKTALSFSLTYPKANKTLNYSIASSGGGAPITGTVTTAAGITTVSGINATTLPDGKLILSAYLTDSIGGTGATVTNNIPMAVLDNSLVGHWTFDANDISGTTATDRSGQGNNGTLTNGPIQTAGKVGGALNFDGTNDFVLIPDSSSLGLQTGITLVALVKKSRFLIREIYLGKGTGCCPGTTPYWLEFQNNNSLRSLVGSGANDRSVISAGDNNSAWYFTALTWNGTSQYNYLDGVSSSNINWSGSIHMDAQPFSIGRLGNLNGLYFQGVIDDVRIYNRALTPTEITTLYNATN